MLECCWFGGARYPLPHTPSAGKRLELLTEICTPTIVGFSDNALPRATTDIVRLILLPLLSPAPLRYLAAIICGPCILLRLILRKNVRVIIAQSPHEGVAAALAKTAARWFGRRVILVVEAHGDFLEGLFLYRTTRLKKLYRRVMRATSSFSLGRADIVRSISAATTDQLRIFAPHQPVVTFPAWTDLDVFLARKPEKTGEQIILFAGYITPVKGIHHLINSFRSLHKAFPEARLHIVGHPQNREYHEELRTLAAPLAEQVRFFPDMSQPDLAEHMSRACVLVLPSLSEGLGRVLLEAQAVGIPVVASNVGGIPDAFADNVSGLLFPPGDEDALTERLRTILTDPQAAWAMGAAGRKHIQDTVSNASYQKGYARILELANTMLEAS